MRRAIPLLLAGTALVAACRSVQPVPVEFISQTKPLVVYLSDSYGKTHAVAGPRISGDTVLGMNMAGTRQIAVPLQQVQQVAALRPSPARTAVLVGGVAAFGALMTYAMITRASGDDNSGYCDYDTPPEMGECAYTGDRR